MRPRATIYADAGFFLNNQHVAKYNFMFNFEYWVKPKASTLQDRKYMVLKD